MKFANKIKISVFCKQGEDEKKIREKLFSLLPFDLGEEKIELKQTKAKGFNKSIIRIYEIDLEKEEHMTLFLENINNKLNNEQKELLIRQINSRLDENLNFFIRLDKDKLTEDKFYITTSGNCFYIKISIAAFPSKREKAAEIVKKIFIKQ